MTITIEKLLSVLHADGARPEAAYLLSRKLGLDFFEALKALRETYGLDVAGAKEVAVRASGLGNSLDEYQGKLVEGLRLALEQSPLEPAP